MSIWCSWPDVGYDEYFDDGDEQRGVVLSYATGWSNHYPDADEGPERPASMRVNHIPSWCVPGYRDDDEQDYDVTGEWVRVDVDGWDHDYMSGGKVVNGRAHISVVLDEKAARELASDLLAWADRPKLHARHDTVPAPTGKAEQG